MNIKFPSILHGFAYDHFLNTTSDLIFFKDTNSKYIAASLSFAHLLGKDNVGDIIGRSEYDLFPEEIAERYIKSDSVLLSGTEKSVTDVTTIAMSDGSDGYMLVTKTPFRDEDGNICGVCGTGHSFSCEKYGVFNSSSADYCIFDYSIPDDTIVFQTNNGSDSKSVQYSNFFSAVSSYEFLHPNSIATVKEHLNRARSEVCMDAFDIVCSVFDTGHMWHRIHYKTIPNQDGEPFRVIGHIDNIQEGKKRVLLLENLAGQMMQRAKSISYDPDIVSRVFSLMYNSRDIDKTVQSILERIGSYYDVSRAYIFENHESQLYCTNTFEWCAPGIEPQKDILQKYEYQFDNGRNVYTDNFDEEGIFLCRDIYSLPQDQIDVLEPQGIHSMIQCAIHDDGVFSGFVGFDECTHERVWTGEQIGTLNLISRLLGIFLAKRQKQNNAAFTADFMSALDQNASFVYIINPENHDIIFSNQVTRDTFGSDFVGQKCYKAFLGSDSPCERCPIKLYQETDKPHATEILWPDGMWVLSQASPLHWEGQHMMMVTSTDITKHMSATEELRVRNREYSIVMKQSGKHIFRFDILTSKINRFYDTSLVFGGLSNIPDTPHAIASQGLISAETVDEYLGFFSSIAKQIPSGSADVQILQGDGSYRWFHYDYSLVENSDGKATYAIASIGDVDAETKATLELTRRAERDGMTGLYNKAATEDIVRQLISRSTDEFCALMIIDLDDLKTINDTLGHACGDNAIKLISSTIKEHFRNTDIVGRIGGDEFLVLLHGSINESVLRTSLSNLVRKISHKVIDNTETNLSCSIGVAYGRCGEVTYEELFDHADTALYHVKRNGKRGFACYSPEMEEKNYCFSNDNRLSLNNTSWFDESELSRLFSALSVLYPLVISVNLTKNSYYMMEYETFKTQSCPDSGNFDELIIGGAETFHPDDRQSFIDAFSRENQLKAYHEGKKTITHTGRQLGDDGIMRLTRTTVIFTADKNGDICQITLSKTVS